MGIAKVLLLSAVALDHSVNNLPPAARIQAKHSAVYFQEIGRVPALLVKIHLVL